MNNSLKNKKKKSLLYRSGGALLLLAVGTFSISNAIADGATAICVQNQTSSNLRFVVTAANDPNSCFWANGACNLSNFTAPANSGGQWPSYCVYSKNSSFFGFHPTIYFGINRLKADGTKGRVIYAGSAIGYDLRT